MILIEYGVYVIFFSSAALCRYFFAANLCQHLQYVTYAAWYLSKHSNGPSTTWYRCIPTQWMNTVMQSEISHTMNMWNVCEYLEQWHLQSPPIPSPLSPLEHMMLLPSGQVLRHSLPPHLRDRELRPSRHTIYISVLSSTLKGRMQKINVLREQYKWAEMKMNRLKLTRCHLTQSTAECRSLA